MDADRLWFKSQIGLGVPQLDRQIAFCAHAVMRPDELLVVEDLSRDPRFRENPLVTQAPHLRFYAGAPLVDRHGYALGTIAVVDKHPREFGELQRLLLHDLSTLVVNALETRHQSRLLGHLAMTDHLTGLANRAYFERVLNSEMAHADRHDESFTVFYMDLNDFKKINDNFGHAAGDEVLCEVSRRIEKQLRAEDVLARFGGDEFGVLLRQTESDSTQVLTKRIIDAVRTPITLSTGDQVSVGISIGMATHIKTTGSLAELLAQADSNLYEAKRYG
jgi:diguanylate cyclase (GGDEF)-like protein